MIMVPREGARRGRGADRDGLGLRAIGIMVLWAFVAGAVFSGVHYVGPMPDEFAVRSSFVFRWILGLALTGSTRHERLAAAVWTHTLYDVWVMVL